MRTRDSVIIDDAAAQSTFAADPYVRQHQARSILCLPLINSGRAHRRDLNRFDDAWHSIDEAMAVIETAKEKWWEAEVNRPGVNCGRCYRA
jgi:GAF domain-containing protein